MTINIVSCLTLFPAILFDLSLSADVEKPSPSQQSPNDFPSQEPLMIESSDNGNTTTKFSYSSTLSPMGVCIWSTVMSSVVAHVSLFAMMSIGKWIRVYTVWKFYDFSITHILCEINFEDCRSAKSAILTHLGTLNFVNLVNFNLQKVQKFLKTKIQSL